MSQGLDRDWPLIGRVEELDALRRLRRSVPPRSAVLSGPPGVGKSTVATAALAEGAREGWATLALRGSQGFGVVPFGPLRTVLQVPVPGDLSELTASLEQELLDMRSERGLLVLVDDAQHLDDPTAGLLHQLVASGALVAVITARTGTVPPDALTDLWKDGLAERIELQNLSQGESVELLAGILGGSVEDTAAALVWRVTEGNPLSVREVVHASRETGSLFEAEGGWQVRGGWTSGARLQEIVATRLGRLRPDESTVVEMLAVGGTLPLELVTRVATSAAVDGLERRGLVTSGHNGNRLEVAIAHPLHAEVLRGTLPALRQRAIRQNLVDALRAGPGRRAEDKVRIACWSIESGLEVDPMTLSLASDASLFGVGRAISSRLGEILPGYDDPRAPCGPMVRQDTELAVRLAEKAFERTGDMNEGFALADVLGWVGRTEQAETVLGQLAERVDDTDDRLRLAMAVGWIRFWCRFDDVGATHVLSEALDAAPPDSAPELLAEIHQELAGIALNTAKPAEALDHAEHAAEVLGVDLARSNASAPAVAALSYLGRCEESITLADEAVPVGDAQGHPLAVAILLFARANALRKKGELEDARTLVEWLRDVALSNELIEGAAIFGLLLGEIVLEQGQPVSAARLLRESSGLFAERDVFGYRAWALSSLARALALSGQVDQSVTVLEQAIRCQRGIRHYDLSIFRARVEVNLARGNLQEASRAAREGAIWARAAGMRIDEAYALDACISCVPLDADVVRLSELADALDSPVVGALALRARALVCGDPEGLLEAGRAFAAMTAWWDAADAASEAARVFDRRHETRAAHAAARLSAEHASKCERFRLSTPGPSLGPVRLTAREGQAARLAASGRANREIAAEMTLSLRTVENHLHRAFVKLGITDRSELADALGASAG